MFTGLIETLGTITSLVRSGSVHRIGVTPELHDFVVSTGGSVCVDGACLTLERAEAGVLYFAAVAETIKRTTLGEKKTGHKVNLERAIVAGARLDGHFVLGHVDGVGTIRSRTDIDTSSVIVVDVPESCVGCIAEKGSIAIDGISLTVAACRGTSVEIAVIPTTLNSTTLGRKQAGDRVNVEIDVLARYVYAAVHDATYQRGGASLAMKMERAGFW